MISSQSGAISNPIIENIPDDTGSDHAEFDIKVESHPIKATNFTYYNEENVPVADATTQTFTMNQNVLQNITESDPDLQQLSFSNSDNMTQFIQMPISLTDVQSMNRINKNVFISQAALLDEGKGLENGNEGGNKSSFLTSSGSLEQDDRKAIITQEDGKQYLSSFSADITGNLFVKPDTSKLCEQPVLSNAHNTIKSETMLSSSTQANPIASEDYSQIVYVQVENASSPQQMIPAPVSTVTVETTTDKNKKKAGAKRKRKSRKSKVDQFPKENEEGEKTQLRALAPRLLSYPLYAGAQASIGVGKTLLKQFDITNIQLVEGGQYFEVLGRCTQCFRFSRTTSYCRAEKNHREPKSSVCKECELAGFSTVVCRRKLNHSAPNAQPLNIVINTALQNADHVKQLCVKHFLPPCFSELHSIVVHHADITFVAQRTKIDNSNDPDILHSIPQSRKATDYARGYLYPYNKEKWEEWLTKYCQQTGTNYRIRTGKRVNKKTDHGLANHNGRVTSYRTLETQLYNCALGGKPRKRKPKDGVRKRKERGSKLIGCPAVIHTRLLETELRWCALEITVPKTLAHLSRHDPRVNANETTLIYHDLFTQMNPVHLQPANEDIVNLHPQPQNPPPPPPDNSAFVQVFDNDSDDIRKMNFNINDVKKNAKSLFLTCASLIDVVTDIDTLNTLHVGAQDMLACMIRESQTAPKRAKRRKEDGSTHFIDIDRVTPTELDHIGMSILNDVS